MFHNCMSQQNFGMCQTSLLEDREWHLLNTSWIPREYTM